MVKENIYEGEWLDGKRSGQGKMIYVNGDVYEGLFKDDKKNGQGKYIWANGQYMRVNGKKI